MLGEALALLVDIKFFDIKNHLLLQTSFVVLGDGNFGETFLNAGADARNALGFVRGDFLKQACNGRDTRSEEFLKTLALLAAVLYERLGGVLCGLEHGVAHIIGVIHVVIRDGNVGETHQESFRQVQRKI